jgi:hypothetical protein
VSNTEIGRKLDVSRLEVGYAVKMGKKLPAGMDSVWDDKDTYFLTDVPKASPYFLMDVPWPSTHLFDTKERFFVLYDWLLCTPGIREG